MQPWQQILYYSPKSLIRWFCGSCRAASVCSLVTLDVVVVSSTSESCKNLLRLQNQPLEEVRVLNGWAWKQNLCGETVMLETSPDVLFV